MTLQAYVDDSGGTEPNEHRVFALAGFVSTEKRWAAFSSDWHSELEAGIPLAYFKMSQAKAMKGEFSGRRGWDRLKIDRKVAALAEIIEAHALYRIESAVEKASFYNLIAPIKLRNPSPSAKNPYYLAFHRMTLDLAWKLSEGVLRDHAGTVNFILDDQSKIGEHAASAWRHVKENVLPRMRIEGVSDPLPHLGEQPTFRDEKVCLPIQAADLLVWHTRRYLGSKLIVPPTGIYAKLRQTPGVSFLFNRDHALSLRADMLSMYSAYLRVRSS